jgi:hypothetical protein
MFCEVAMAADAFDRVIDEILAEADGDARQALRAVLQENFNLEAELRHLYAVSAHGGKPETKPSLH